MIMRQGQSHCKNAIMSSLGDKHKEEDNQATRSDLEKQEESRDSPGENDGEEEEVVEQDKLEEEEETKDNE